ncbi:Putative nuclease HARBI1 [Papilio xuthus]|uniref:Putative nuclease HARBI1 n=1 Tax=Papilio xuthus TaxID=66420 RepID=A0A194QE41_PAPXU|nr:Putative nuclease HARBI1 [Papilio xuthus]
MSHNRTLILLTDTIKYNDNSDSSSWSDMSFVKSESSEDDDEDDRLFFPLMHYLSRLRRKRLDEYLHMVDSWSDSEFKNRLRLSRKTAYTLIDELEKSGFIAQHKFGLKPLEPKLCFYIFLSFIANTEPLTPIATRFDISVSSAFRVIRRVVAWLLTKLNDVIKWPANYTEIQTTCDDFQTKTGISDVLGVIDCMHIKIEKPKNAAAYYNSKGYFSITLQATFDANMRFINVYCGEPGSSSAARVLRKSPLYQTACQNRERLLPQNTFLIGHSGYSSLPWLMGPFRESNRLTVQQREFNTLHASARIVSKKAFKLLKNRFKRVKYFAVYRNIAFIIDTVVAACILHNYCVSENDHFYLTDS